MHVHTYITQLCTLVRLLNHQYFKYQVLPRIKGTSTDTNTERNPLRAINHDLSRTMHRKIKSIYDMVES